MNGRMKMVRTLYVVKVTNLDFEINDKFARFKHKTMYNRMQTGVSINAVETAEEMNLLPECRYYLIFACKHLWFDHLGRLYRICCHLRIHYLFLWNNQ